MYQGLLHFHSIWRYAVLLLILLAIAKALSGWFGKKDHLPGDTKLALFAMISLHIQLLTGLILYTISPAVNFGPMSEMMKMPNRFWTVEHLIMMIVAVAVVTVGRKMANKAADDLGKHKRTALFYSAGLLVIFFSIPWPWTEIGRAYFPF
ncbi:MAG: hypothetical protein JKY52_14610 [Flavobacteriales bacterium]|nr:hypothetical protein [Flavobacteriales bacterium]